MIGEPPLKPVIWVGTSHKDIREFPASVQDRIGYALYVAQQGGKHLDTKPLTGFAGAVYVLHTFQKKSKTGHETPKRDMELIEQRLRQAERIAKQRSALEGTT